MTTTLEDIRFLVERNIQDQLENAWVVHQANVAQTELLLRVFIPGNTTLAINTTDLVYTLSASIQEIRRLRLQSDLDRGYNRAITPVYTLYNGKFEVPVPFSQADTMLIDYYAVLKIFSGITDPIDLEDRFNTLYTTYIEAMYYNLPSTRAKIGETPAMNNYQLNMNYYQMIKKQVTDSYINAIGTEKPGESGW